MLAVAVLGFGTAVHAAGDRDPFDTRLLYPSAPSSFWQGPQGPSPCPATRIAPDPLRLVDAIDLALCQNPRTRQTWANAKVAAAEVGVARSDFLPNLDGSVALERGETLNTPSAGGETNLIGSLSFNWLLFDFGGRDARLEQARQTLLAADWTHNDTLQRVMLDAVQSYYLLYATREAVRSAQASVRAGQQSLDAARARQKAGSATRADVLQAQTSYSQAVFNLTQAQGNAANAQGVLANALGLNVDRDIRIVEPPDLEAQRVAQRSVAQLLEVARLQRPDLAAADAQVRAAQSNVRAREADGKPSVSLGASLGATQVAPGFDPQSAGIGISVSIPIFTGYRNTYRVRSARDQVEVQVATRDKLREDVALEVWRAYQDLRTQDQSLSTAADLQASAQEAYNAALARYKAGVGTLIDLLNAQTTLASASLQQIRARLDWNVAKATLARAIGVLDPALVSAQLGTARIQ
jgi:TolC family type I secretion outer membrane protein